MRKPTATAAVLAAALLLCLSLSACGGAQARRGEHMERGQEYFVAGNYDKARVEFRNALQVAPEDPEARFMNARVAEKLGSMGDAARLYQATLDVNADHVRARAALGRLYLFSGAADRAMTLVEPGLVKHPDDSDLLTVRGAARAQMKDSAGALADAEKALQVAPDNENAAALVASLYQQTGQAARAVEVVRTTLAKVPSSLDLRQVLASLYASGGDQALAEEQLKEIVKLKPNELRYRVNLALSYARSKRLDEAEQTLDAAVKALPANTEAKLGYVEFLVAQRSPERGMKALQDFIAREPKNYELQFGLGTLQQRTNHADDALATYGRILASDKDGAQGFAARLRIAAIHAAANRLDEASTLVAEVLAKNPHDNDALILRGNIALERKDPAAAIADLRAVLRDQPRSVSLLRTLARAHVANGDNALAEDSLRTAMDVAPTDVAVKVELGQLLTTTGRADDAVTILEETVKGAPENVAAREALVRGYIAAKNLDSARRAAEDLKLTGPNLATGPYLAGLIAHAQQRFDDARREFEKALQLQPNAMDVLTALTRLDTERGRGSAAAARLQSVAQAEPKNAFVRNMLAELYFATKEPAKAIEPATQALQIAPKWWAPHRTLALARISLGDNAGAIAAYEAGIKATDYQPTLATDLATLYERQNRVDDAIRLYDELHRRNPRLDLAANNLAMLLITYKQDQASLDRARDLSAPFATSNVGAFLDTHGWVRFKRGEFNQALPVLERAVAESPDSRLVRFHLGMALYKAGQRDQAITNLEKALDGGAKFSGADEARSALAALKGSSAG
ncbi:MAG: tetratricopeptide repeat protein [Gammaproteobacteria bacterium]